MNCNTGTVCKVSTWFLVHINNISFAYKRIVNPIGKIIIDIHLQDL